jgi:hypothetical protein
MDFFQIGIRDIPDKKGGGLEAYPDFIVDRSEDLMVRAKNFYAIWDEEKGLWSTDEYDVQRLVDANLKSFAETREEIKNVKYMRSFGTNGQTTFRKYMSQIGDNAHQLDDNLTFLKQVVGKKDYASKRLPYDLSPGDHSAWDELAGTLYKPVELAKIEWTIGSIVSGEAKTIQKFLVLYGPPGAGKGTIINIIEKLFPGYVATFDAKALGSSNNQFASAAFSTNPLIAIQHDGDLSRIEDNTLLNSIISHEHMKVNEKFKPSYDTRINAFLVMGTNKPVKITDAQSGIIRRLIDAHPSGVKLPPGQYHKLMDRIDFELGAIAHHCLEVYKKMGKNYYSNYQPLEMMFKTNAFFNFIEANFDVFERQNGVSAKQAWTMYKDYCQDANIERPMTMYVMKSELGNYFEEYHDRIVLDGVPVRSYYSGFKAYPFKTPVDDDLNTFRLILDETTSLLDLEFADCAAQYAKADGSPSKYWDDSERIIGGETKRPKPSQIVNTYLCDLDTSQEHYVKPPENHIVVDFDLVGEDGTKSLERNLEAASHWPPTYAEISRSGKAVHIHYDYDGDVERLDSLYGPGIEIKRFPGNSALRRRLTRCNNIPVARISSGLPLKENKRVLDPGSLKSEKGLRALIVRNLRKEIHPGTKPSIDFIKHILDEAYQDHEFAYDVSDMRQAIVAFANNSSNKPIECLRVVKTMKFKSEDAEPAVAEVVPTPAEERLVFFDVEVFPNLFMICWKFEEENPSKDSVITMINPKPHEVENFMRFKLVGFNVRNYDNHILMAASMGYDNEALYRLSSNIINGASGARFGSAYKVSHTDIFDYSSIKMSLKKWQIKLGLEHRELDIPFDQPVPESRWKEVEEYCVNDVVSEEFVHKHLKGDWVARQILADLADMTVNDSTANLAAKIIFGNTKNPKPEFVYPNLKKEFPGYEFELGKSTYRGEQVGEGGYVYAEPGIYQDVALLDVASMHPTSILQLNLFGDEFTPRFRTLVEAQLAIKHGDYGRCKGMFGGKLTPYIEEIERLAETDPAAAKKAAAELRYGLKIAINIVYGMTSAKFDNPFKDWRNIDNVVAKRGALFMVDLKNFIQEKGFTVAHIKTDSVKIPNATPEIIDEVKNFADKYGYSMEHEATYSKLGLVNDAVYVAKKDECISNCWTATGTQYIPEANPFVFKTLFGHSDDIGFSDFCIPKHVKEGKMYLDFGLHYGENDPSINEVGPPAGYIDGAVAHVKAMKKAGESEEAQAKVYADAVAKLIHVGRSGLFVPVKEGYGGGQLWRVKDGKHYAVTGTKGYLWVDANVAMDLPDEAIDMAYFDRLVEEARANLDQFLVGSGFSSLDEFLA